MDSRQINDLVQYRLKDAADKLDTSRILLENGKYKDSIGRSYYAIFHSVRAVLALDGVDRKKHSGVIAYFQQNYIKTGIFDKKFSRMISDAFDVRMDSDYEDFFMYFHDDVERQLENAKVFYKEMEKHIEERLSK